MKRFILLKQARGSSVALLIDTDNRGAWVRKWRSSARCFARPRRVPMSDIVGDALPSDPRRLAAEEMSRKLDALYPGGAS